MIAFTYMGRASNMKDPSQFPAADKHDPFFKLPTDEKGSARRGSEGAVPGRIGMFALPRLVCQTGTDGRAV